MLNAFIRSQLNKAAKDLNYDLSYAQFMLEADRGAFFKFAKLHSITSYRRDVPAEVAYAVKLVGTMHEDCGPCSQLMITMALREGVPEATLRAVARGDDDALPPEVALGVRFARAVLARDAQVERLRDEVLAHWGKRGLISLAFGLIGARAYPTIKYALGFARSCTRLSIGQETIGVRAASAAQACV